MAEITYERAMAALRKADAAGNTEDAKRLAALARSLKDGAQSSNGGAPLNVRAAVGAAQKPEDRLATLQGYFPDARALPGDNFEYTDPNTGQKTKYNPSGLDKGDFASLIPEVGEFIGGSLGAARGAVAGGAVGSLLPIVGTGAGALAGGAVGAGTGAAGGREIAISLADKFLPTIDTRTGKERLKDAGKTAALNAGGQVLGEGLAAAYRGILAPSISKEAFKEAAAAGATPTVGQTLGGGAAALEKTLSQAPFSGAPIRAAGERQALGLQGRIKEIAAAISPDAINFSKDEAGGLLKKGVVNAVDALDEKKELIFDKVLSRVPKGTQFQPKQSLQIAAENAARFSGNAEAQAMGRVPQWQEYAALVSKPLSVLDAKSVKTSIWNDFKRFQREGDQNAAAVAKQFYDAFNADIRGTVEAAVPTLGRKLKQADLAATKAFRLQESLQRLATGNAHGSVKDASALATNEAIFNRFIAKASEKGQADLATVRVLKRRLPPEDFRSVSAAFLSNMGLEAAGKDGVERAFSPRTFLTEWKNLNPEARRLMFDEALGSVRSRALQTVAEIADTLGKQPINTSATAASMSDLGLLTGGLAAGVSGADMGVTLASAVIPRLLSEASTSQALARAVNMLPREVVKRPYAQGNIRKIVGALSAAAVDGQPQDNSTMDAAPNLGPRSDVQSIDQIILNTIDRHEGGYVNDKADRGGATKYGISSRAYPNVDVANLSKEDAVKIYREDWFGKKMPYLKQLPAPVAAKVFDIGVNVGAGGVRRIIRDAVKELGGDHQAPPLQAITSVDPDQFLQAFRGASLAHYQRIVAKNPSQKRFLNGWEKRALS